MASSQTEARYSRDGARLIQRSNACFPGVPTAQALTLESGLSTGLERSTVRRYKPAYRSALAIGQSGECGQVAGHDAFELICNNLAARTKIDHPLRTAALQNIATELQAELTFNALKRLALAGRNPNAIAAALYVLVVPKLAVRPIELLGARIDGGFLVVKNAKRRPRQKPTRRISLKRFPETLIEATRWLIKLAEAGVAAYDCDPHAAFDFWRNALAACLARTSTIACKCRLSLYSFRHIGIATWKRAGFTAEQIAQLAGHLLAETAARHYASASKGWGPDHVFLEPVPHAKAVPIPDTEGGTRVTDVAEELAVSDDAFRTALLVFARTSEDGEGLIPVEASPALPVTKKAIRSSATGENIFAKYRDDQEAKLQRFDRSAGGITLAPAGSTSLGVVARPKV